jgi:hypothetical protein
VSSFHEVNTSSLLLLDSLKSGDPATYGKFNQPDLVTIQDKWKTPDLRLSLTTQPEVGRSFVIYVCKKLLHGEGKIRENDGGGEFNYHIL